MDFWQEAINTSISAWSKMYWNTIYKPLKNRIPGIFIFEHGFAEKHRTKCQHKCRCSPTILLNDSLNSKRICHSIFFVGTIRIFYENCRYIYLIGVLRLKFFEANDIFNLFVWPEVQISCAHILEIVLDDLVWSWNAYMYVVTSQTSTSHRRVDEICCRTHFEWKKLWIY